MHILFMRPSKLLQLAGPACTYAHAKKHEGYRHCKILSEAGAEFFVFFNPLYVRTYGQQF
jgi:Na+/H+ antiporter NhaD/arsenite permease-like protein